MENDSNQEEISKDNVELEETKTKRCRLPRGQIQASKRLCAKEERNACVKKVSSILQKIEGDRTLEDNKVLRECGDVVDDVLGRWKRREEAKRRLEELEDPADVLKEKCHILAQAIAQSQHLVVYTGAGISTSAKIPDYRGSNGIWTRLQQGKEIGNHDLTLAEPTFTHMALSELYRRNILKYVVSQNCDGLHLRSGLPKTALSELHGNMYIEVCKHCKPHREYWRLFDVTEHTARYAHKTFRKCYKCNEPLVDSIVHFGERGKLQWPLNWSGACKNAAKATTILCLGSSLKVLKRYPRLWQMDKPAKKRPNLYIINLQWTPKDDFANVKVNGKCDEVMKTVMDILGIDVPKYDRQRDPIYVHASPLHQEELHTTTQPFLKKEKLETEPLVQSDLVNKDCTGDRKPDLANKLISGDCDKRSNKCRSLPDLSVAREGDSDAAGVRPQLDNGGDYFLGPKLFDYTLFQDACQEFFHYPYQTSFLYSGLHSIIKPLPVYDELFFDCDANENSCEFCMKSFVSSTCLFYSRSEPVFLKKQSRYSKTEQRTKELVCLCCDYSTDEDDSEVGDRDQSKGKIQAGWFGKGYRKGKRTKRRSV
nr:NAD-dependent protein deacetylase sirtuin-7 isoform X1 [Leptinotarsa decemlineata]